MARYSVGIDFGTTFSSAAVRNLQNGKVSLVPLTNEGAFKIPSAVYFGSSILVGTKADELLTDEDEKESARVFPISKRYLGKAYRHPLPGGRLISAEEAAAAIFGCLKEKIEEFTGETVKTAVITHPATFGQKQKEALRYAVASAGIVRPTFLEEPVAAAIACISELPESDGSVALVYDLGGGTFDTAVVKRHRGSYRLLLEAGGIANLGGETFDALIYDWFLDDVEVLASDSQHIRRKCRQAKERLSSEPHSTIRHFLHGKNHSKVLTKSIFETLVDDKIGATTRAAKLLNDEASEQNEEVTTIFLVGGSAVIPLIRRRLKEMFGFEPLLTSFAEYAVAMGAAIAGAKGAGDSDRSSARSGPSKPDWAERYGQDGIGEWASIVVSSHSKAAKIAEQRLRWIDPGRFLMGSSSREHGHVPWNEAPRHEVTISRGFWIFETPCSQALWDVVLGENRCRFKGSDLPVENVSWDEVQKFVAALQAILGNDAKVSLPTEAEWEFACRAGTSTPYGLERATFADIHYMAKATSPVQKGGGNGWGIRQCHGNVFEWCLDGERMYNERPCVDPIGAASWAKVVRGGAWTSGILAARSAHRGTEKAEVARGDLGFRCLVRNSSS